MASGSWLLLLTLLLCILSRIDSVILPGVQTTKALGNGSSNNASTLNPPSAWQNRTTSTSSASTSIVSASSSPNALRSSEVSSSLLANVSGSFNATTSSGFESAETCLSRLLDFKSSSTAWDYVHTAWSMVSYPAEAFTYIQTSVTRYQATKVTTVCDGHPRVVGTASPLYGAEVISYTNIAYSGSVMQTGVPAYPVAAPSCTIAPASCQSIYDTDPSSVLFDWAPLCSYTTSTSWTSTESAPSSSTCGGCYIMVREARLLYWPVRTVEGSDDLCGGSAMTTEGTPTATAANTFVTEGITITSPSVGISFADISRLDQCGSTYSNTILVVDPDQVSSVRGAWGSHNTMLSFEFQHLNYKCGAGNDSAYSLQDEPGDNCYQDGPANAYFSGVSANMWDSMYQGDQYASLTIGNDYRPYVAAPDALVSYVSQVWGANCYMDQMGVWDPPRALTPVDFLVPPTTNLGPTTTTSVPTSTPASPTTALESLASPTSSLEAASTAFRSVKMSGGVATGSATFSTSGPFVSNGDTPLQAEATKSCGIACKIASILALSFPVVESDDPISDALGLVLGVIPTAVQTKSQAAATDHRVDLRLNFSTTVLRSSNGPYAPQTHGTASAADLGDTLDAIATSLSASHMIGGTSRPDVSDQYISLASTTRGRTSVITMSMSAFTVGSRLYTIGGAQEDGAYRVRTADHIITVGVGVTTGVGDDVIWSAAPSGLVYHSGRSATTILALELDTGISELTALPGTETTRRFSSEPTPGNSVIAPLLRGPSTVLPSQATASALTDGSMRGSQHMESSANAKVHSVLTVIALAIVAIRLVH